ncbi:hypothetical protein NO1_1233 [Candidatus Termititenax aidoneus]|uniref:Major tropism determinant second domain-containing protein n=1 Tax=Termititenax aidoneus TaxID=2218524 RepID=A0A388TB44_TERA1|nr:hypothetical protein NO1_1233 [Candidatus Termititenax aidoneus]
MIKDYLGHTPFIIANKKDKCGVIIRSGTTVGFSLARVDFEFTTSDDFEVPVKEFLGDGDRDSLEAGKDYYIYITPFEGKEAGLIISIEKNIVGRLIGGFHTLCADVGEIAGHPLSGYKAGDILPNSIWCLNHRSAGLQDGMVYDPAQDEWVMIYMASGTGKDTASRFGAKTTNRRNWHEFNDDMAAVGCRLLSTDGFMTAMWGSPNEVNVENSENPITTGGHKATNGQRIISNIGVEDGVGCWDQWLSDRVLKDSCWYQQNGVHTFPLAGGNWTDVSAAGVLCWGSNNGSSFSFSYSSLGARGRCRCLHFAE